MIKRFSTVLIVIAGIAILSSCNKDKLRKWSVLSPDSTLKFSVILIHSHLCYQVESYNGEQCDTVIGLSPLGICRQDEDFSNNLSYVTKSKVKHIDQTYKMLIGKKSLCHDKANEVSITFKNKNNTKFNITARAYSDGVAFRYEFTRQGKERYTVISENTGFKIPSQGRGWMIRYDKVAQWSPGYERDYKGAMSIGTSAPDSLGWALPALFNAKGYWMLICEANMDSTYCGIHLQQKADKGLYKVRFPEMDEGYGVLGSSNPSSILPWITPWRIIIIGKTPAVIIENTLVYNLSAANKLQDTTWIKPGRASWSWWSDHNSPTDENKLKAYVDLAKAMTWEYSLVDAMWNVMKIGNIENVIKYANSKNIGITLWYNSGGPHNKVFGDAVPRDLMDVDSIRQKEFARIEKLGVKGIKVDFFQSDKQRIFKLYLDILADAAKYHLLVDFHGCTIPRGWSRTYPNLMSMEAVSGSEQYSWDTAFAENAQTHNSILPFTRNTIGPMDYTPVTFTHYSEQVHHKTTYAHEAALTVVFESGILHFADRLEAFYALPDYVKDFFKTVPVAWDDTRYIIGEPSREIVLARRKGQIWYLAGINGEKEDKVIAFSFAFLNEGKYMCNLIIDGKDATSFDNKKLEFTAKDKIKLHLHARGGFVGTIEKK